MIARLGSCFALVGLDHEAGFDRESSSSLLDGMLVMSCRAVVKYMKMVRGVRSTRSTTTRAIVAVNPLFANLSTIEASPGH